MKSMMKILTRYVLSAAGVTLILLVINFAVLVAWTVQSGKIAQKDYSVSQLANGLTRSNGVFTLSESVKSEIEKKNQWAMLLNDNGNVIWNKNVPSDVPLTYSISDVACFTRWYLNDYPVYVWRHPDGLFVLGSEKESVWKQHIQMPQKVIESTLVWFPAVLILNGVASILLALLFGMRLFRSLKPLAKGIEDMAEKRPVELSINGLLGDLAAGINKTSAQLAKQEASLNKRDNARTTWIAGVSHDIRTPLSLVMGYASQFENDPELSQAKREQAGIIRRQSERIKTLISDLNLASKLEYDMQPIRQTTVPLSVLLRSVVADFLNGGLNNSYSIDVMIGENAQNAIVSGDEELLKRAVSNLITNSVRHNPNGCTIKVTLEIGLGNCSVSVSDNGVGFTHKMLNNLNHPISSVRLENHGLGLTIVRQIIKAHGGTTEFRNLPEGGCIIVLCLPVSNAVPN
ncbi:HAMP domain-containing sensor histidine kinase [Petroclostridium sp. X23]|uniref:sensor histidine kinase n=1 Tax=Petroclostridium sp. X23 TaxID=3045146 RepID=UPI0024ADE516|nr:HAMP domain-containing sensor histidine kinase [Petroclostridium sp. X23]WHH56919.1 HAMP domain-containing sensor histidine kinase [Petroclostridium sp. X23]